jgi:tungstate transport system substrate-binding protein
MVRRINTVLAAIIATLLTAMTPVSASERFITLASTTSTDNSGLFGHLLPIFTADTNVEVRVVAHGTGQAIRLAQNGDADVLLVHHRPSEEKFITDGYGIERRSVMYNDFIIVGPREDPARITGLRNASEALSAIARTHSLFISRGDDSGTHKTELRIWQTAGVDVSAVSGSWYRDAGSGMGATLNIVAAISAYTLSDRATWIAFRNKGNLVVVVEKDPRLFNQYGVITVNQQRHPHVKSPDAQRFVEWLTSAKGQAAINAFTVDGQQLFFANYSDGSS